jgi:hypothetical protein
MRMNAIETQAILRACSHGRTISSVDVASLGV